ncbi:hypothetical protein HWV62_27431 [Athelia sp. TMB]|nr:hypothetical protein HWV62_27431 [Athelia sp. TMB]
MGDSSSLRSPEALHLPVMLFATLAVVSLLVTSIAASPTPVIEARAANPTIYVRIEGPTKTIYEQTTHPSPLAYLTNNGHTAKCNGPKSAPGVTSLAVLQETGQFFQSNWTGKTFGEITKLNGTSNNVTHHWGVLQNYIGNDGKGPIVLLDPNSGLYCSETLDNLQHMLYAFLGDYAITKFLILSGPKTAKVGETVQYKVPDAPEGTYVNDLSVDTTTGQRVYAEFGPNTNLNSTVSIKFTKKGTYNLKAHCPADTTCVRSNHVVTVVS